MPGLVTATMPDVSGIPADATQMSFSFDGDASNVGTAAIMSGLVANFFTAVATGATHAIGEYIAASRSRLANAVLLNVFNLAGHLDGSPHGSPTITAPMTLPAPVNTGLLADQLAALLSFEASLTGILERGPVATRPSTDEAIDQGAPATHSARTRPRASRRGRVWVGPLCTFTQGDVEGSGIKAVVITDLQKAAHDLIVNSLATTTPWVVWSRAIAATNVVDGGWVDQRFATQRRRRDKAIERSVWT